MSKTIWYDYFTQHNNLQLHPCCCKFFCPFLNWVVCFLLSFESPLYILDTSPLPDKQFVNIFFQFVDCFLFVCLFVFLVVTSTQRAYLILMQPNLTIILRFVFFVSHLRMLCLTQIMRIFSYVFFSTLQSIRLSLLIYDLHVS